MRSSMQFSSKLVPRHTAGFVYDSYTSQLCLPNSGGAAFGA